MPVLDIPPQELRCRAAYATPSLCRGSPSSRDRVDHGGDIGLNIIKILVGSNLLDDFEHNILNVVLGHFEIEV